SPATTIAVQFSEPVIVPASSVRLFVGGVEVPVTTTVSGAAVTAVPASQLAPNTTCQVVVSGTVTDLKNNPLGADDTWSFTTTPVIDGVTTGGTLNGTEVLDGEIVLQSTTSADFNGATPPA